MLSGVGIRIVRMAKGLGLSKTLSVHVAKANVSSVTFTDPKTYATKPAVVSEAFKDTVDYAAISGLDAAGAETVKLAGGYHKSAATHAGPDHWERTTGEVGDAHGNRLYFYRKSDHTFWDRVHFPRKNTHDPQNAAVWARHDDYIPITKAQFDNKKL